MNLISRINAGKDSVARLQLRGSTDDRTHEFGAGNRNRTYDPIITNDVLYQLSYSGVGRNSIESRQSNPPA